jgi:hypothetical protein
MCLGRRNQTVGWADDRSPTNSFESRNGGTRSSDFYPVVEIGKLFRTRSYAVIRQRLSDDTTPDRDASPVLDCLKNLWQPLSPQAFPIMNSAAVNCVSPISAFLAESSLPAYWWEVE